MIFLCLLLSRLFGLLATEVIIKYDSRYHDDETTENERRRQVENGFPMERRIGHEERPEYGAERSDESLNDDGIDGAFGEADEEEDEEVCETVADDEEDSVENGIGARGILAVHAVETVFEVLPEFWWIAGLKMENLSD